MKVRATRDGYYANAFRKTGDVFELKNPDVEFSQRWMVKFEPVPDAAPSQEPLPRKRAAAPVGSKNEHPATSIEEASSRPPTGDAEVI